MQKNKTTQKNIIWVTVFISFLTFVSNNFANNNKMKVAIIPFDITYQENRECGKLQLNIIVEKLTSYIKRSKRIDVDIVTLTDSNMKKILPNSKVELKTAPQDKELDTLIGDLKKLNFSYLILGQIKVAGTISNIITVECQTINCNTGKIEFFMNAHKYCKTKFEEVLARELQNQFEMNMAKKIRIGILNFKMTYCDTTQSCPSLEEAIPTMLGTALSISEVITLVEMKEIDQLLNLINADTVKMRKGIYNRYTALEIGNLINVNYLIMGEYWYHDGEFRIDSRCVNIETGEIILSRGITIDKFRVEIVSKKIDELAQEIRKTIEVDLLNVQKTTHEDIKEEKSTKILSVVCFPPYPDNRSNRLRASNIRKTISSKLRQAKDIIIKDDVDKINQYLTKPEDRMKIIKDLNISDLLSVEFENYNDEDYILSADAYGTDDPTKTYFNETRQGKSIEIDSMINSIVFKYLGNINNDLKKKIRRIKVPTYLERFTFGIKSGNVKRNNRKVFMNDGIGEYFEAFINYNLKNRIKVELFSGLDIGKRQKINPNSTAWIYSIQPGVLLKYNLNESRAINPYLGIGGVAFILPRAVRTETKQLEEAGDLKAGLITLVGLEFALENFPFSLYLEPRYILGMKASRDKTASGFEFAKGRLGGLYLLWGGIGINFNL